MPVGSEDSCGSRSTALPLCLSRGRESTGERSARLGLSLAWCFFALALLLMVPCFFGIVGCWLNVPKYCRGCCSCMSRSIFVTVLTVQTTLRWPDPGRWAQRMGCKCRCNVNKRNKRKTYPVPASMAEPLPPQWLASTRAMVTAKAA